MSEFPDLRQPSAFDPTIKVGQTTPNLPTDPQPVRETAKIAELQAQLADHTDLNRQVLGLWKTIRDAQNERGTAELEAKRLRELCGCVYQFIGANMLELGGCRRFLDALSNASEGRPFDVEHLLPYSPEEPICMTDVAQPAILPEVKP
jgi:hypothetical protein